MRYWKILGATLCLFMASVRPAAAQSTPLVIYDMRSGRQIAEADWLDRLASADVVCVGEQHTDPSTHRLELSLLRSLHQRAGKRLTLGMEMWERDVQPGLTAYLAGRMDEAAFLKTARPWSNYVPDYRPLVEYAKAERIPVAANNVPQAIATAVGRHGLDALKDTPPGQAAPDISTPHDRAWTRFRAVMLSLGSDHGGTAMDEATIARFYDAQVVRDATMADSIVRALDAAPGTLLIHINGQFHSDYGDGIPRRIVWQRPLTKVLIVSVLPVPAPTTATPPRDKSLADYVVYVPTPPDTP